MAKPKAAYTKRQGTVTSKAAARQEERVDLATADTDDEKVAAAGDQTLNDQSAPSGGGAGSVPVILGGLALLGGAAAAAGAGNGSEPVQSTPAPAPAPPPAQITYTSATLTKSYQIYQISSSDVVPEYVYAGVTYPKGIADIFPQGSISVDFQKDRFPELIIPLNKAYGTPVFARLPFIYLSNDNGKLEFRKAENEQFPSVFGARRSSFLTVDGAPAAFFVAHNVSGIYNDPTAHGTAVLVVGGATGAKVRADLVPPMTTRTNVAANGTDAHAMATGDINGDGRQDILIANWNPFGGAFAPMFLIQNQDGSFTSRTSSFLNQLNTMPLLNPGKVPEGQNNLWLDVHIADLNGDGFGDIVAGFGHGSSYSYIFWNNKGEFSFENKTALPTSVYGTENSLHMETRTADIDNDGDLDLIISYSRYVPYYGGDYLQILRNDAGQFLDITSTAIKQADADVYGQRLDWSPALYITDLNKDGKADIVFARQDGTLRMYINEGGSTFRNVNASLPKNEGWGKLIGFDDFDGDGSPEAVYWQYGGTPDRKDYFINLYELTFA